MNAASRTLQHRTTLDRHLYRAVIRCILMVLAAFACVPSSKVSAQQAPASTMPVQIQHVADFAQLDTTDPSRPVSVRLDGIVWWANPGSGRLILSDDSGVEQLELNWPCTMPGSGDLLHLEGKCWIARDKDVIRLISIPVVDNDGQHEPVEKSGSIYLKAGRYPIQAGWFSQVPATNVLEVTYQGPGLVRQRIPDSTLFHRAADSSTENHFVPGLDYRCFQGMWWTELPDLFHLPAVRAGTSDNFDISKRSREAQNGMLFSGYLEISMDGDYTFYTRSSDGSRLFVGPPSISAKVTGHVALPQAPAFTGGLLLSQSGEYFRTQVEGTLSFVNRFQTIPELELSIGSDQVRVVVADASNSPFPDSGPHRVRIVGIGRRMLDIEGEPRLGEFFVQDWKEINPDEPNNVLHMAYPVVRISSLKYPPPTNEPPVAHVLGKFITSTPSGPPMLEDESGTILATGIGTNYQRGDLLDVVGVLSATNSHLVLQCIAVKTADHVGGTGPVAVSPALPVTGKTVTIRYKPAGRLLASASQVYIHLGWNNWNPVISPDAVMAFNTASQSWEYTVAVPTNTTSLNFVFNDGSGTWDNNNSLNWNFYVKNGSSNTEQTLTALTTVEEIYQLGPEKAAQYVPVKLRGIVTSLWPSDSIILQDTTRAIFVSVANCVNPRAGEYCEIEGTTADAAFAPYVLASRVIILGEGIMPAPLHPTWDRLLNGRVHCEYVELEGVVTRNLSNSITLLTPDGLLNLRLNPMRPLLPEESENALIRIRGCVISDANRTSRYLEVGNLFIDQTAFEIVQPAPKDVFDLPVKAVNDLLAFDPQAGALHRVKVAGQLVYKGRRECYLMDGQTGLRFFPAGPVIANLYDQVEVVGFPDWRGASPSLREAVVRRIGPGQIPDALQISPTNLLQIDYDATRVKVQAMLLGITREGDRTVLETQSGPRRFAALLEGHTAVPKGLDPGCKINLTGIYAGEGGDRPAGRTISAFHLLLASPDDIQILARPPWWDLRHSLIVLAVTGFGLIGSLTWVRTLRKRVELRTHELREEIQDHQRTEASLNEQTRRLKLEIEERARAQREVERVQAQLIEASRQAGKAEVAIGVLHNVGNVLNSVNVSTSVIAKRLKSLNLANIGKVARLMQDRAADLGHFLTSDERGRCIPGYLDQLSQQLNSEQEELLREATNLGQGVDHINSIVAMQQAYAKPIGVLEMATMAEIAEHAISMHATAFQRHEVKILRDFEPVPPILVDRHKVLEILINLLQNARQACGESHRPDKQVTVRIRNRDAFVRMEVADNGIGIAPHNLNRIFSHGFTTRHDGHGFGLHSAALAAKEMKGALTVESDGPGTGATFILELPRQAPAPSVKAPSPNPATPDERQTGSQPG